MIKKIYICDKCKKETENREEILSVECKANYGISEYQYKNHIFDLCERCRERLGLIKRVIKNDQIKVEPQDLKDKLYDVLSELVYEIHPEVFDK